MTKHSGLADSPFFTKVPIYSAASPSPAPGVAKTTPQEKQVLPIQKVQTTRLPDKQSDRVTESETPRVPEQQTSRLPDFEGYVVPDYRKMQRIEVRLTWDQNKYLDDLEALIGRDAPEGEKADPDYRRITKNSILRVVVEILRTLGVQVDASRFKNERDLLRALHQGLTKHFSESETSRGTE